MDHSIQTITKSAQETADLGKKIGSSIATEEEGNGARVYCLYGQLGSGKTTFIQGFVKGLGIPGRLLSPTFIIVRRYNVAHNFNYFYHIDLYRLTRRDELEGIGIAEILSDPKSIIAIEWAEKLGDLLPKRRVDVVFSAHENGNHQIQVTRHG